MATQTDQTTDLVAESTQRMGRWNSNGDTWHRHAVTHVHPGGDAEHHHLFATDQDILTRLQRVLDAAATRSLSPDERADAAELRKLTV